MEESGVGRFGSLCAVALAAVVCCGPAGAQRGGRGAERTTPKIESALKESYRLLVDKKPTEAIRILNGVDRTGTNQRVRKMLGVAYAVRGRQRFDAKKYDIAYRDFFSADRLTPGNENILQGLGASTMELRRTREAKRYMERVLEINPENEYALVVLGEIASGREKSGEASHYFRRAAKLDPKRKVYSKLATKYGKQADVEERFITLTKGNFRVQFERGKTVGVEQAVQSVHSYLEQAYRELSNKLGQKPTGRITVVVYNQSQYRRVSSMHSWARAYYDGKLRVALKSWPAGRTELRRDLRHELTHAFLHELHPKVPLWVHEGMAQVFEGRSSGLVTARFRTGKYELLPSSTFTGRFANTKDIKQVTLGYAQSLMLVGYLHKLGQRKFQSLLREFDRGLKSDAALRIIYRKGLDELLRAAMQR